MQRVMPCIEHQLTCGLRDDASGELDAWCLGDHPYGAIGKVFTVESHRRKGLSTMVCAALTRAIEADAAGEADFEWRVQLLKDVCATVAGALLGRVTRYCHQARVCRRARELTRVAVDL